MTNIEQLIQTLCPNGVPWKTLGEVCDFKRGSTITANQTEDGCIPVIAGGQKPAYYHNQSNREGKNITVAGSGAYAGYVAYWELPIFVSDAFTVTPKDSSLNIKYLYYFLTSIQDKIYHTKKGSGVPHVHPSSISSFEIPLPPLEIQNRIVEILDRFSALAAELQAELQLRRKQYEYYRTRLLTPHSESDSTDKTDDATGSSWQWKTLGEVCEMKAGLHISAEHIKGIVDNEYIYPCFGGNGIRGYVKYFSHEGDFPIIGRQGALCGCVSYAKGKFYATEHAVVVKPNQGYNARYLFHMLTFADLNQYKSQGAQPGLAVGNLNVLSFPLPPLPEQARIVSILDKFEALTTSLSDGIPAEQQAQQKRYEYYRDLLLNFSNNAPNDPRAPRDSRDSKDPKDPKATKI